MCSKFINNCLNKVVTNERSWLFFLSLISSIMNYAFQIYIGRKLAVSDYGRYNYIVTFMTNCCAFYLPLSVIICRSTAENDKNLHISRKIYCQIVKAVAIVSVVMFLFILVYHLKFGYAEINWLLLAITTISAGLCSIVLGVVQGLTKYIAYGLFNVALMGIKFALAILIAQNTQGAVLSLLFSEILVLFFCALYLVRVYRKEKYQIGKKLGELGLSQLAFAYGGTLGVQLLNSLYINNGEILLMKNTFPDDTLGLYSVAAMLSRIGMYATAIISTIILPEIAYNKNKDKENAMKMFNKAILISFAISVVYAFVLLLTKDSIIFKLYGDSYSRASELVDRSFLLIVGVSILPVINSFFLGINRLKNIIIVYVIGAGAAILFTYAFSISFNNLIIIYGIVIVFVDLIGYLDALFIYRRKDAIRFN